MTIIQSMFSLNRRSMLLLGEILVGCALVLTGCGKPEANPNTKSHANSRAADKKALPEESTLKTSAKPDAKGESTEGKAFTAVGLDNKPLTVETQFSGKGDKWLFLNIIIPPDKTDAYRKKGQFNVPYKVKFLNKTTPKIFTWSELLKDKSGRHFIRCTIIRTNDKAPPLPRGGSLKIY